MERVVEDFILYLHETKNTSKNTEVSYERDLKKLIRYLQEQNLTGFSEVTCTDLQGYLNKIKVKIWRHRRFPEILRRSGLCIII